MNTVQGLKAARALITPRDKWCTTYLHKNGAHCALGALAQVHAITGKWSDNHPTANALFDAMSEIEKDEVRNFVGAGNQIAMDDDARAVAWVASYNNTHSHDQVLALFDRAIARCQMLEQMLVVAPEMEHA